MTTRSSPPPRPPLPVLSPRNEVKAEPMEEDRSQQQPQSQSQSQQSVRGVRRPREESPRSRSTRRRLAVEREFQQVNPCYIPFIAEFTARQIGCALVPQPLTPPPDRPSTSCAETQTTSSAPVTVGTQITPPSTPPERPPPPRIVERRVAVMSTMPRPRPVRTTESAYSVLRGASPPTRPTAPARPASAALGAPPARPPSAALGAPPARPPSAALGAPPARPPSAALNGDSSQEEGELPDLPDAPYSPAASDITIVRLV